MKIPYFPGCSLYQKYKPFSDQAKESLKLLGHDLVDMEKWYCCQADFSLVTDNMMCNLSTVRTLVSAKKEADFLLTICSTCYYALKRVEQRMKEFPDKKKVVYEFLEEEIPEDGKSVAVYHLLDFIKEKIGFDALKEKASDKLKNLKTACYYGCQLVRPKKELGLDDHENPVIFEDFAAALGADPVIYPNRIECCGSFLITRSPHAVETCTSAVIRSALEQGAQVIVTSCPLCYFNLDWSQREYARSKKKMLPVLFITELLALGLGLQIQTDSWKELYVHPGTAVGIKE